MMSEAESRVRCVSELKDKRGVVYKTDQELRDEDDVASAAAVREAFEEIQGLVTRPVALPMSMRRVLGCVERCGAAVRLSKA